MIFRFFTLPGVIAGAAAVLVAFTVQAGKFSLEGIKGEDNRLTVAATEYPWSAIGRINKPGGFCTGTLIGPRLVLTAAHCLWNGKTRRFMPAQGLHFVAGYQRGAYVVHSPAIAVHVAPDYVYRGRTGDISRALDDWAVIVLAKDIGNIAGYLGIAPLTGAMFAKGSAGKPRRVTVQAGYSRDKQHVLSSHLNCDLLGFLPKLKLVAHACDAISGDSGAPIFVYDQGGFRVVAMHVATSRGMKKTIGVSVPSSRFLKMAKKHRRRDAAAGARFLSGRQPLSSPRPPRETIRVLLEKQGYTIGDGDGGGAAAIRAYQKKSGLRETGRATAELLGHLIQSLGR